ncbi:hypothetical protein PRNP1_001441 [Phytophthora ramorum]
MSCSAATTATKTRRKGGRPRLSREGEGVWTSGEHIRFLEALQLYPHGPWKLVAAYIGTRSTRQAMTHAQKYRQKIERRRRGLRTAQAKRPKIQPTIQSTPETVEHAPMMSFEQLITAETEETWRQAVDWRLMEPIPLTTTSYVVCTEEPELPWIDDCLGFFVDSFSS